MKTIYLIILGCLVPLTGVSELSARTNFSFSLGCAPVCCAPVVCAPVVCAPCAPAYRTVYVNSCNPCYDYVTQDCYYTTYHCHRAPRRYVRQVRHVQHVTHCTTYAPCGVWACGHTCN